MKNSQAFAALEALTVVFMAGLLVAIFILIINPQRQLADARNAERASAANTILSALNQYMIDNKEAPPGVDNQLRILGTASVGCDNYCLGNFRPGTGSLGCLNLKPYLVPKYLIDIPTDPILGTSELTYYAVRKTTNDRIEVYSCGTELGRDLTIIR